MLALRAVVPDGVGAVDGDDERLVAGARRDGHKVRVEARVRGRAGAVEGALDDRVRLGPELEGEGVAVGGSGAVGLEGEAVLADDDVDVGGLGEGDEGRGGEEGGGGEVHGW